MPSRYPFFPGLSLARQLLPVVLLTLLVWPVCPCQAVEPSEPSQRQAEVAGRGSTVMPFSLAATLHVFTPEPHGGTQRVVTRRSGDAEQAALIRRHLQEIRGQFLHGDFSAPAHIHGDDMPGLRELEAARPGQLAIDYREVDGGAELVYRSDQPGLVDALHRWFAAQLADHGGDAMEGHMHHHPHMHEAEPAPHP